VNQEPRDDLYLFTDCDLDGAGCYYILRKVIGSEFRHTQTTEKKFRTDFTNLENKEKYKKIYICDLAVIENNLDIIDLPNVVYINHRNSQSYAELPIKNLRQESIDSPSCTLLLYKKLKEKLKTPFTKEEKTLIALVNDYDSYELKLPESKKLHFLFNTFEGDKLLKFYNTFENGFTGFNPLQENTINNIINKINSTFSSLKVFKGSIKIGGIDITICSAFNNIFPSEICDMLIQTYECDIAISVNLNSSSVSIRKNKNCGINLGKFAKKVFEGGGDDCVAGGKITKTFLELTKLLHPIK
jgi:oligoribonuclease NrnB/cAMP/cGMP phosphodiesterase (DHH superfamily)